MLVSVLLCVISFAAAAWHRRRLGTSNYELPPPYPGHLPIIGHLHLLLGDGKSLWILVKNICKESNKQGGVISMNLNGFYYIITDPEDALIAANSCLQKHFIYDFAKPWLGEGLITGSGEIWKRHRKLLTPAFGLPVVQSFLGVFNSQSRKLVKDLEAVIGKPFDHTTYLRTNALETFCQTAFGIHTLENRDFIGNYMDATEKILRILTMRFQNPLLQSDLIFKLSGLQRKQDKLIKILNDMSDTIIQRKKAALQNGNSISEVDTAMKASGAKYKAFLDLLMDLSQENALTDKEIREEVDTAIMTGFDTSSSLLSYIMILLGTHPEVQEKLYKEIQTLFATDRDVEKQDMSNLEYTEAVIKESLRVFTTGPLSLRYVDKSVKLKNYTMQPGSQCILFFYGTNRSAAWGQDAEVFRPERWLEPGGVPENPNAFAGFSLGKRSCLGRTYAMLSMKTQLVHFLRRYRVMADDSNLQLQMDFLLKPITGHEITIENRY